MCDMLDKRDFETFLQCSDRACRQVQCARCGEVLAAGEGFYRIHGFPYCEFCLDSVDAEELVRICEIPKRIWLSNMGFAYGHVGEGDCL